jgi:hypothetical protein
MIGLTVGVLPPRRRVVVSRLLTSSSTISRQDRRRYAQAGSGAVDLQAFVDELGELAEQVPDGLAALVRAARTGDDRAVAECCGKLLDRVLAVDKVALALVEIALVQQQALEALRARLPETSKPTLHEDAHAADTHGAPALQPQGGGGSEVPPQGAPRCHASE